MKEDDGGCLPRTELLKAARELLVTPEMVLGWSRRLHCRAAATANTMISETAHPIKKAAALRRALAVASNKASRRTLPADRPNRRPLATS
jgi:hypothetical protein